MPDLRGFITKVTLGASLFFIGLESPRAIQFQDVQVTVIETNLGRIRIQLFPEKSPKNVELFIKRARDGFYDGTRFHKVLPGLLIEGGDPQTAKSKGASSIREVGELKIETNDLKHEQGSVSMAHQKNQNSSGSEFFICLQAVGYFDGKHTVIGKVLSGLEVVEAISKVPRNLKQAPLFPIWIEKLSIGRETIRK